MHLRGALTDCLIGNVDDQDFQGTLFESMSDLARLPEPLEHGLAKTSGRGLLFLRPARSNYYCGVCMRDNSLALHLIKQGHEVTVLPAKQPHLLDEDRAVQQSPIFGGVNVYLRHKFPAISERLRGGWTRCCNSRQTAASLAGEQEGMTTPRQLGELPCPPCGPRMGPLAKGGEQSDRLVSKSMANRMFFCFPPYCLAGVGRAVREELGIPAHFPFFKVRMVFSTPSCLNSGRMRGN